ncbi:MAG: hypothetical protein WA584_13460 [Pyrinomonadaceae bacterium]
MNKTDTSEKETYSTTSDFIKIRPEVRFINDDDGIVIITASGYKRLNSKWIKKLHEKIYPVLLNGCSKDALLKRFENETRTALSLYLQALEKSDSFIKGNIRMEAYRDSSGLSSQELTKNLTKDHDAATTINLAKKNQILIICTPLNLFQILDKLKEFGKNKQIIIFLLDENFTPDVFFTRLVKWHMQAEPFLSKKLFSISFFRWDDNNLSCALKFRKTPSGLLSFSDLIKEIDLISPVKTVSQLPLSIVSLNHKKMISLNYKSAAESLLIGEIIKQTAFTQNANDFNFVSSASRLEIRAKILDESAAALFESTSADKRIDALNLSSGVPAIDYLQKVLRVKISTLPVKKDVSDNCFYRFSGESCSFVSLSEKKALHDFLLFAVYSIFYSSADFKTEKAAFHSNILMFESKKELKKMIKSAEKLLKKNYRNYTLKINKVSTFWGNFYWGKAND